MQICSLLLRNVRLYEEMRLTFSEEANIICGNNAFGKTTILEALHCLMCGRSFRSQKFTELIRENSSFLTIEATFLKHGVLQRLFLSHDSKEKRVNLNSTALPSLASLIGILPGVLIAPDDVEIVKGSPMKRRYYLDLQLSQSDPLYVHYLTRYTKALQQRNVLLRKREPATLSIWEEEMASAAAYIILQRHGAIKDLQPLVLGNYQAISGDKACVELRYETTVFAEESSLLKEQLLKRWCLQRSRELERGETLSGPHKDDIGLYINSRTVREHGSEGEQRCCIMALKLSEWQRLSAAIQDSPMLLIDDAGLGLDTSRKKRLLELASSKGQMFLTATDRLEISNSRLAKYIVLEERGKYMGT